MQIQGLTVQRVSGALRSGGYKAAKYTTTAVRGWSDVSAGFKVSVTWPHDGSITVSWIPGKFGISRRPDNIHKRLKDMSDFLAKQGFDVETYYQDPDSRHFKVRAREKVNNHG